MIPQNLYFKKAVYFIKVWLLVTGGQSEEREAYVHFQDTNI